MISEEKANELIEALDRVHKALTDSEEGGYEEMTQADKVEELIRTQGFEGITRSELYRRAKLTVKELNRALEKLVKDGKVRVRRDRYSTKPTTSYIATI